MDLGALLAVSRDRLLVLRKYLESCNLRVLEAGNSRQAVQILNRTGDLCLVVTDQTFGDGDWKSLRAAAPGHAAFVLCLQVADPMLWIDALEAGAYDVLVEPYEEAEVRRITEGALLHARRQMASARRSWSDRYAAAM